MTSHTPPFLVGDTRDMTISDLALATNRTFEGYFLPVVHTTEGFSTFCRVHNLDLARSVTLRNSRGELAGLTMLGIREERGWCGGFGIIPEFRGQRLAAQLLEGLITAARSVGLKTLQLEVLSQNERAISVYLNGGMVKTREVVSLIGDASIAVQQLAPLDMEVTSCSVVEALRLSAFVDTATPTWQRESVMCFLKSDLQGMQAVSEQGMAVLIYGFNRQNGILRIEEFVFDDVHTAHGLLVQAIHECEISQRAKEESTPVRLFLLNEPEDSPLYALFSPFELQVAHRQHEMRMVL